jgi:hypothetical protein
MSVPGHTATRSVVVIIIIIIIYGLDDRGSIPGRGKGFFF